MCQQDVSRLLCPITPTLSGRTGEYKRKMQGPLLKTLLRISRWRKQRIKPRAAPHVTDLREDHGEVWQAHFSPSLPHHFLFPHVYFFVYLFTICPPHWNVRIIDLVYLIQHRIPSILAGRHSRNSVCRKKGSERRRESRREGLGGKGRGGREGKTTNWSSSPALQQPIIYF